LKKETGRLFVACKALPTWTGVFASKQFYFDDDNDDEEEEEGEDTNITNIKHFNNNNKAIFCLTAFVRNQLA
jgi:hypothetical protein